MQALRQASPRQDPLPQTAASAPDRAAAADSWERASKPAPRRAPAVPGHNGHADRWAVAHRARMARPASRGRLRSAERCHLPRAAPHPARVTKPGRWKARRNQAIHSWTRHSLAREWAGWNKAGWDNKTRAAEKAAEAGWPASVAGCRWTRAGEDLRRQSRNCHCFRQALRL